MYLRKKVIALCIVIFVISVFDFPGEISFYGQKLSFHTSGKAESMTHINYKEEMITLIEQISSYAKSKNGSFEIINNNGMELFRPENVEDSSRQRLISSINGVLIEDYSFRWEKGGASAKAHTIETPPSIRNYIDSSLTTVVSQRPVFVVDYCQDQQQIDQSYQRSQRMGYLSLASSLELDSIPHYPTTPRGENNSNISSLKQTKNFLILLNPSKFANKETYLESLRNTNYDLLIIDMYFDNTPLTIADVTSLKVKKNGAPRLVFAYMSVGEAEDYRSYWQKSWSKNHPNWIAEENPDWTGNFKVKYWTTEWKQLLFGSEKSYLDMILATGFNGVFMDVIDAFDYFENK